MLFNCSPCTDFIKTMMHSKKSLLRYDDLAPGTQKSTLDPIQQPTVVFPEIPPIDLKSVESKLFIKSIPQFLIHSYRDWCFLSVQIWTYSKKKKIQHFRSSQNNVLITFVHLNIFRLFFYCFFYAQPCVISNYIYEIALCCIRICAICNPRHLSPKTQIN